VFNENDSQGRTAEGCVWGYLRGMERRGKGEEIEWDKNELDRK
jgi:hypothetical protein